MLHDWYDVVVCVIKMIVSFHTLFFSGYGNISPNNTFGRIFMIFYALIGLPVNGFFFAYLGDMYGKTVSGWNVINRDTVF